MNGLINAEKWSHRDTSCTLRPGAPAALRDSCLAMGVMAADNPSAQDAREG